MIQYLVENKEWIFSGIGVAMISWLLFRKSASTSMRQKSGDNSKNIQVGGSFNIGGMDKNDGDK